MRSPSPVSPRARRDAAAKDTRTRNFSLQKIAYGANKGRCPANNVLSVRMRDAGRAGEARTRAEAYAEAAGMRTGRVLTIRDGGQFGGGNPVPMIEQAASDAMAVAQSNTPAPPVAPPPPPSIRPGAAITRVPVQVDFALEPK